SRKDLADLASTVCCGLESPLPPTILSGTLTLPSYCLRAVHSWLPQMHFQCIFTCIYYGGVLRHFASVPPLEKKQAKWCFLNGQEMQRISVILVMVTVKTMMMVRSEGHDHGSNIDNSADNGGDSGDDGDGNSGNGDEDKNEEEEEDGGKSVVMIMIVNGEDDEDDNGDGTEDSGKEGVGPFMAAPAGVFSLADWRLLPAALPWTPPLPFLVPPSGPSPNQKQRADTLAALMLIGFDNISWQF
ncbi:hypothetical protein STEG23_022588, partial [Scotinomys teguina]